MKRMTAVLLLALSLGIAGCSAGTDGSGNGVETAQTEQEEGQAGSGTEDAEPEAEEGESGENGQQDAGESSENVTADTLVSDVVADPDFEGFGQFLFPLNGREPDEDMTLDGIETEFHHYPDLQHGFGLGIGTSAEGWIDDAVDFWQEQIDK